MSKSGRMLQAACCDSSSMTSKGNPFSFAAFALPAGISVQLPWEMETPLISCGKFMMCSFLSALAGCHLRRAGGYTMIAPSLAIIPSIFLTASLSFLQRRYAAWRLLYGSHLCASSCGTCTALGTRTGSASGLSTRNTDQPSPTGRTLYTLRLFDDLLNGRLHLRCQLLTDDALIATLTHHSPLCHPLCIIHIHPFGNRLIHGLTGDFH